MKAKFFKSQLILITVGVGLGYLARLLIGPPEGPPDNNRFLTPSPVIDSFQPFNDDGSDDGSDLPIRKRDNETARVNPVTRPAIDALAGGLVPPIQISMVGFNNDLQATGSILIDGDFSGTGSAGDDSVAIGFYDEVDFDDADYYDADLFAHDSSALFEPHGQKICASGCAASRHPTAELEVEKFQQLMSTFSAAGPEQDAALEELLYYGPQTRRMIRESGFCGLDSGRRSLLWNELKSTHATIEIRVVDESGRVRTWSPPTRVPLDRRHIFQMKTDNLQPLITSGTVKRVGLDHLWVRL